jgi:Chalcone isomerase-like
MWLRRRLAADNDFRPTAFLSITLAFLSITLAFLSITLVKMRGFVAAATCCEMVLSVAGASLHQVSGVSMPEVVTVDGFELRLNGMGLFKEKTIFKVYVAGLYLEKPTADAQAAIDTDEAKRIVLVMLRDVSREAFVHAVETGMLRNSSLEMPTLRARLDLLEQALPALKKGNVLDFTYVPGAGTLVRGQDKEMTIPGKDFADALFSAWLGMKPANATLKRQLLGEKPPGRSELLSGNKLVRP